MENSIIGRSWSSVRLFIIQNYTNNANGDVPLIKVEQYVIKVNNIWTICEQYFLWDQGAHMFFWEEKQNWSILFFIQNIFIEVPVSVSMQVYSNRRVPTQVNTSQHKSTWINTSQQESTRDRHKSTRAQHESTQVRHESTHESTRARHEWTRVN